MGPTQATGIASWKRIALVTAIRVGALALLHGIDNGMDTGKSDLKPVQIGIKATLHHEDPYSDSTTRQIQTAYYGRALTSADHVNEMSYVYPIYTAYILAPLAWLTFEHARICFLVVVPVLIGIGVLL